MCHPRGGDRQRAASCPGLPGSGQAEVKLALAYGQVLPGGCLQNFRLRVVVRGPDVLDVPRSAPGGSVRSARRSRPRRSLPCARRGHKRILRPEIIAQIRFEIPANLQVSVTRRGEARDREPGQVSEPGSRGSRVRAVGRPPDCSQPARSSQPERGDGPCSCTRRISGARRT